MKKSILAFLLCAVMMISLSALAFASVEYDVGLVQFPDEDSYFDVPKRVSIRTEYRLPGDHIYIMPKPQPGDFDLGLVGIDELVTVLAEQDSYYFFVTDDGRYGWNCKDYFAVIIIPQKNSFLDEPFYAVPNVDIYIMPQSEQGHGDIGILKAGKPVKVLAEENGYYFFESGFGLFGWNGKKFFSRLQPYTEDRKYYLEDTGEEEIYFYNYEDYEYESEITISTSPIDWYAYVDISAEGFDDTYVSYVYLDGKLYMTCYGSYFESYLNLDVTGRMEGRHHIEIVQYEDDVEGGQVVTYKHAVFCVSDYTDTHDYNYFKALARS